MRYKVLRPVLALCGFATVAQGVTQAGRAILHGVIVDSAGAPLRGVEIHAARPVSRAVSDDSGRFRLDGLESGAQRLSVRRLGLAPETLTTTVSDDATSFLRIILRDQQARPTEASVAGGAAIASRFEGFERRRSRQNGGQFITRQDIERIQPTATSDMVRRMQGIRLVDSMGVVLAVSTRGPKMQMVAGRSIPVQCVVRIGIDGQVRESYFAMNTIPLQDIYGIEVYAGAASLPSEFSGARRDAACGLIMIWIRSQ